MCGIIGYIGRREAGPLVLQGLKLLEYRGYDSAGSATVSGGKLFVRKDVGKIDDINGKVRLDGMPGLVGIGHTRWATTGAVTKENSHPHTDCGNAIAVVHNGIIENYQELRAALEVRGHQFRSQTDTEVIPHLVEDEMKKGHGFAEAVWAALRALTGSYAILAVSVKEPDKIVAARRESPLVIGLAGDGVFAASDAVPLLEHTKKAVFLDEGEGAVLSAGGVEFFEIGSGKKITKPVSEIRWTREAAAKGGYSHFMLKEIMEEPQALKAAIAQDDKALTDFAKGVLGAKKVIISACGTSRHAALVGRYAIDRLAGKYCDVMIASEYSYFAGDADKDTLLIAVSQSGETADILDGVRKAKAKGAKVFSIVNVVGSTLDRLSDNRLYLNCGPEIAVASTKAFAAQLAVFYLVAFAMAGKLEEGRKKLAKLPGIVEEALKRNEGRVKALAEKIKGRDHAYYIARGINFAIALEGALKMKEVSYIHAEGMPAGELKHGTLALIESGTPVIAINPSDHTRAETLSNALETKARGAFLVGVSDENNEAYDEWIELPRVEPLFYPLVSVIPLQLLAYHAAVARGLDPDKPRNLAKSVTVK
ncbi:MAG: glutamine--fructose-6-phosphate transaminase (isomerizing) [Candidatus Micrarchaeota archaeon]|nr:glutamine--fructose-6-phosphate transaminase (isomerizing) [Candidatus Micrarchaeota archaeon]